MTITTVLTELDGPFTCDGDVRGDCGHKHTSIRTASRCLRRDQRGCRSTGGYSDRRIVAIGRPLTDDEIEIAAAYEAGNI